MKMYAEKLVREGVDTFAMHRINFELPDETFPTAGRSCLCI
jgi:hypothetical protein